MKCGEPYSGRKHTPYPGAEGTYCVTCRVRLGLESSVVKKVTPSPADFHQKQLDEPIPYLGEFYYSGGVFGDEEHV